jgi:carbonic anhydrase/acetyltransferase-like protein (isoleucine patch superfamily)
VLRGVKRHPLTIDDHCLVGPHAHLTGCTIGRESFIATRAAIFNGAVVGEDADIRIGAVVHVGSVLPARTTVPIHWIAVGDPAQILPPERHDDISVIQRALNFPKAVFGVDRDDAGRASVAAVTARYARALASHDHDRPV